MNDLISRQELLHQIEICRTFFDSNYRTDTISKSEIIAMVKKLPSIRTDADEWCPGCKEYDQQKHCCSRFNKVIRRTLAELEPKTGERN